MKMVRIALSLPETLLEQLREEKERTGSPITEIIRRAVIAYFREER